MCVGLNYKDHCLEQNLPIPEEPVIFSKFPSAIIGNFGYVVKQLLNSGFVELLVLIGLIYTLCLVSYMTIFLLITKIF